MCKKRKKQKGNYKVTFRVREVFVGIYECASKTFLTKTQALSWIEKNKIKDYKIEEIERSSQNEIVH
jgi:hypothetical protein